MIKQQQQHQQQQKKNETSKIRCCHRVFIEEHIPIDRHVGRRWWDIHRSINSTHSRGRRNKVIAIKITTQGRQVKIDIQIYIRETVIIIINALRVRSQWLIIKKTISYVVALCRFLITSYSNEENIKLKLNKTSSSSLSTLATTTDDVSIDCYQYKRMSAAWMIRWREEHNNNTQARKRNTRYIFSFLDMKEQARRSEAL